MSHLAPGNKTMMIQAECPHCQTENTVPDHAIGRYVDCKECHCRFYVPVPVLGSEVQAPAVIRGRHRPKRQKADRPVSQNGRQLSHQEQLLTAIQTELVAVRRLMIVGWASLLAAAVVIGLLILFLWRT